MSEVIKLVIAVPTAGKIDAACYFSSLALIARLANGLQSRPDAELQITNEGQISSVIPSNRELLVRHAIDTGKTHLLFIDDDMGFHPQAVDIMFSRRHPVVACNYLIKRQHHEDPEFVAVGMDGRRVVTSKESTGLQEIQYSGFGLSLFEVEAFAKTPQPWFHPDFVPGASCYTTEDNPCYRRLRESGHKVYLDHDASKLVDHNGLKAWKWDQWTPAKPKEVKPNGSN